MKATEQRQMTQSQAKAGTPPAAGICIRAPLCLLHNQIIFILETGGYYLCCQLTVEENSTYWSFKTVQCISLRGQRMNRERWVRHPCVCSISQCALWVSDRKWGANKTFLIRFNSFQKTKEEHYLSLVVGAHVQITEDRLCSNFVVQLLVRCSVISWPEI